MDISHVNHGNYILHIVGGRKGGSRGLNLKIQPCVEDLFLAYLLLYTIPVITLSIIIMHCMEYVSSISHLQIQKELTTLLPLNSKYLWVVSPVCVFAPLVWNFALLCHVHALDIALQMWVNAGKQDKLTYSLSIHNHKWYTGQVVIEPALKPTFNDHTHPLYLEKEILLGNVAHTVCSHTSYKWKISIRSQWKWWINHKRTYKLHLQEILHESAGEMENCKGNPHTIWQMWESQIGR